MEGQFEPQPQEQYIPALQSQVPQQFEPQVQQQFEPQILQSFEPQIPQQSFEPQVQPVNEEMLQNKPKDDTPKENEFEPQINNNMVMPMIEQDDQSMQTNTYENMEVLEHRNYSMHKVFIFYLVLTVIYVVFGKFPFIRSILWTSIAVGLSGVLLFLFIRCYDEKYDNKACSIFILIFFFAYKICFILFIYCLVDLLKFRYLYVNNNRNDRYDSKNKTIFGNFDFAHLALFVYYLTLIIFTYLSKVHLLIYFIIGAGITVVMFCSLIAINVVFAGLTAAIIFFEISVLLLTLKIAISKNKLDDKKFIDNMIIIDYYKYAVLMIISFIVLTIIIYMLYVISLCLNAICKRTPTSVDSDGNVYDQFNSKIGHFSRKPKYVDSDGNVYDKNHNKIEPDCNIF